VTHSAKHLAKVGAYMYVALHACTPQRSECSAVQQLLFSPHRQKPRHPPTQAWEVPLAGCVVAVPKRCKDQSHPKFFRLDSVMSADR
jgi:hypothetical protein